MFQDRLKNIGSIERHPVTSVGKINLKLHKVKNNEKKAFFKPVEERREFDGKKVYQEDISVIGAFC